MGFKNLVIYFLTGGLVTVLIVALEERGSRLWSGLATLAPVFTVVAYLFIGSSRGGQAVSQHAKLVLLGTLVSWVPYMIVVILLAPKLGAGKATAAGLATFTVLAMSYLWLVGHYKWFQ